MQKLIKVGLVLLVMMAGISCEENPTPSSNTSSSSGGGSSDSGNVPLGSVQWVNGNSSIAGWEQTVSISSASISGNIVQWTYETGPGSHWTSTSRIHGNPNAVVGWVANIDGTWYGAIGEWLPPGLTWQQTLMFKSDRGNTRLFGAPLQNYEPTSGQVFYIFVCGLNMGGLSNVQERSNLVRVVYP